MSESRKGERMGGRDAGMGGSDRREGVEGGREGSMEGGGRETVATFLLRALREELEMRERMCQELREAKEREVSELLGLRQDLEMRLQRALEGEGEGGSALRGEPKNGLVDLLAGVCNISSVILPHTHTHAHTHTHTHTHKDDLRTERGWSLQNSSLPEMSASELVNELGQWDGMEDTITLFQGILRTEKGACVQAVSLNLNVFPYLPPSLPTSLPPSLPSSLQPVGTWFSMDKFLEVCCEGLHQCSCGHPSHPREVHGGMLMCPTHSPSHPPFMPPSTHPPIPPPIHPSPHPSLHPSLHRPILSSCRSVCRCYGNSVKRTAAASNPFTYVPARSHPLLGLPGYANYLEGDFTAAPMFPSSFPLPTPFFSFPLPLPLSSSLPPFLPSSLPPFLPSSLPSSLPPSLPSPPLTLLPLSPSLSQSQDHLIEVCSSEVQRSDLFVGILKHSADR